MTYSRFNLTPKITYDDKITYGKWKQYKFLTDKIPESSTGVYVVTANTAGRPDLIAGQLYGTTELDWVLLAFNNVRNPMNWPAVGELIRYPVDSIVIQEVYQ
jgi:hypothetical protein